MNRPKLLRRTLTPEVVLYLDSESKQPRAVSSSFPREDWRPRQATTGGRLPHPGTALVIDGKFFEIRNERPDRARPTMTIYGLAPWEESATIRHAEELNAESCRDAVKRYLENVERLRVGRRLSRIPFLTGLLPADIQLRWEDEYGVSSLSATAISAMPILGASVFTLFVIFAQSRGHDFGDWSPLIRGLANVWPLLLYLISESMARMWAGLSGAAPVGTLLVAGPIVVLRAVRDALRGKPTAPTKTLSEHAFSRVRDTIRPWPGPEADIEVRSRLPKEHWTIDKTGLSYEGNLYLLVDRNELQDEEEPYQFLLQIPEREVLYHHIYELDPAEVQEIYRQERLRDTATWVETVPYLWGQLDHDRQERLAAIYDYKPEKMTLFSILFNVVVAGIAVFQGYSRMRGGILMGGMEFLLGLALLWECGMRFRDWRGGRWRASVLGTPFRGLADQALRWERTGRE